MLYMGQETRDYLIICLVFTGLACMQLSYTGETLKFAVAAVSIANTKSTGWQFPGNRLIPATKSPVRLKFTRHGPVERVLLRRVPISSKPSSKSAQHTTVAWRTVKILHTINIITNSSCVVRTHGLL